MKYDTDFFEDILEIFFETEDCDTNYWIADNYIVSMVAIADRNSHICTMYDSPLNAVVEFVIPAIAKWWTVKDICATFDQEQIDFMVFHAKTPEALDLFSCATTKPVYTAQPAIPADVFATLERLCSQEAPMSFEELQTIKAVCDRAGCLSCVQSETRLRVCIPALFDNGKHLNLYLQRETGFKGGGYLSEIAFGDAEHRLYPRSEWDFVGRYEPKTIAGTYYALYGDAIYRAQIKSA